jgi:hypothetical protein
MTRILILTFLCLHSFVFRASAADDAGQLLAQSRATGGLVVLAGTSDGALASDIAAARPSFVVHALVRDAAQVQPMRERFRSHAVAARLLAELWKRDALPFQGIPCAAEDSDRRIN